MSWTVLPISQADVRGYLDIQGTTGSQVTDARIGSNIRAAASFLQRETGRQFEEQNATTKTFTTEGRAYIAIPDLRTVTSATAQGAALTAGSTYNLIPDQQQSGVYIGIQFRQFNTGGGSMGYLANPEWFDRNLDQTWGRSGGNSSLPNDLVIVGDWGHRPLPHDFTQAVLVLASFYTRRPASVLADVQVTPEGTELRFGTLPVEVREFLGSWTLGSQLVSVAG